MTGQPEEVAIALGGVLHTGKRQVVAPADQCGRVAVLQPAVALADGERHEAVAFKRRLATARLEQADLLLADAGEVRGEAVHIELRDAAR